MPKITLVICLRGESDLLTRLLAHSHDCYDQLIVIHDGPVTESGMMDHHSSNIASDFSEPQCSEHVSPWKEIIHSDTSGALSNLIFEHRGRLFIGPRCFQQEAHWPFAWSQSDTDWILRLDADEYPSRELANWLIEFREQKFTTTSTAGFSCIWPLWNGQCAATKNWPSGRLFLFNRRMAHFIGMAENTPTFDGDIVEIALILKHEPFRKSYGFRNVLFRSQAYHWRRRIADQLLRNPNDLPRWRFHDHLWPAPWNKILAHPIRHLMAAIFLFPLYQARKMMKAGEMPTISACVNPMLTHAMLSIEIIKRRISSPR